MSESVKYCSLSAGWTLAKNLKTCFSFLLVLYFIFFIPTNPFTISLLFLICFLSILCLGFLKFFSFNQKRKNNELLLIFMWRFSITWVYSFIRMYSAFNNFVICDQVTEQLKFCGGHSSELNQVAYFFKMD